MKVTFLTGSLSRQAGGFLPILQRLSSELSQQGCDLSACGVEDTDFAEDRAGWAIPDVRVFPKFGPARLSYSRQMRDYLRTHEADLLHLHGLWMGVSALNHRWHRRTGRPYLVSAHGMLNPWAVRHQRWKKRIAGALYENANLRDATCLHALSAQEVQDYREYGLRNPVAIIPNGVDLPPDAAETAAPPWQEAVPPEARVLLFLGRIHAKKGLIELIEGWKRTGPSRRSWRLVIAGWDDGGHLATVSRHIAASGLEAEVSVVGPQFGEGKAACLSRAHGFVLPSHSEGLPVAVLEAWAHRLPAVLTPACNLPEGFSNGAAIRIEPDPGAITAGLEALFSLPDVERRAIGERGRQLVESAFTWPAITERMLATYRWLLGHGPKPHFVET